jgi:hypothetical protein
MLDGKVLTDVLTHWRNASRLAEDGVVKQAFELLISGTGLALSHGSRPLNRTYDDKSVVQNSEDTMRFSAMAGVRPMTETFPLEKIDEAYERMMSNKARFRVVITTGN